MEKLLDIIKAAGPAKLAAALAITGLVAAALFAIMFRVGAEPRALLYADLTPQDASAVTTQLETSGIEYQMSPDGSTISFRARRLPTRACSSLRKVCQALARLVMKSSTSKTR